MRHFKQGLRTHQFGLTAALMLLLAACSSEQETEQPAQEAEAPPAAASNAVAYEGARLIVGDESGPIENGVIVVEDGLISAAGPAGDVMVPEGAERIDLSGATVMPMMVDTHVHLNTEREPLIEDLRARARFGVSAAMSLGMDATDAVFAVREEEIPGAARYFTAGRGITRPEPGRTEVPHWVSSEAEARQAVRDEAAVEVDIIKIWVDDRDGQYEKLSPDLYQAVIDEAHQNDLRVTAHIYYMEDAKQLLQAGIDAFAHGIRDQEVDQEVMDLFMQNPDVVVVPNLAGRGVPTDYAWLEGKIPAEQLQQLQSASENPDAQEAFAIQAHNLNEMNQAGVRIALGTDGNTPYAAHVEIEDMVISGMSPAEAIHAATGASAEFLGIDTGILEAGKSADFIVLEANPLDDITNTRMIREVYLRGELVQQGM